jgi:hypothetical protein
MRHVAGGAPVDVPSLVQGRARSTSTGPTGVRITNGGSRPTAGAVRAATHHATSWGPGRGASAYAERRRFAEPWSRAHPGPVGSRATPRHHAGMSVEQGSGRNEVPVRWVERVTPADARPAAPRLGSMTTPWVLDLIGRFRAEGSAVRTCSHLADDPDDGAVWLASVPDLRSCRRPGCTAAVAAVQEERLGRPVADGPASCTTCGTTGVVVRGVGVAVGPTMLRGTVCEACLAARPVPTPAAIVAPPTSGGVAAPVTVDDEPIEVDREELARAEDPIPFHRIGRRALRRGHLMADACCRSTRSGLGADQAVVGGLLVRAAKLARGVSEAPPGGSYVTDLAFRSLVGATADLWWAAAVATPDDLAAFRASGSAGSTRSAESAADRLRGRLRDLGREDDLAAALGGAADADPGTWAELETRHLSPAADGFALDVDRGDLGPMQLLVAGEHLARACVASVDRLPTDLDPDVIRRLADELTTLRAAVEEAFAAAPVVEDDGRRRTGPSVSPPPA